MKKKDKPLPATTWWVDEVVNARVSPLEYWQEDVNFWLGVSGIVFGVMLVVYALFHIPEWGRAIFCHEKQATKEQVLESRLHGLQGQIDFLMSENDQRRNEAQIALKHGPIVKTEGRYVFTQDGTKFWNPCGRLYYQTMTGVPTWAKCP